MHGKTKQKNNRWHWQNEEGIQTLRERLEQHTRGWDHAGSHRIGHGFYQQAALLLGIEGSVVDADMR